MQLTLLFLTALLNTALCLEAQWEPHIYAPNNCPEGYTGQMCDIPICDTPGTIDHHDSMQDDGDLILWDYSLKCNQQYQFFVDEYITNISITVYFENEAASVSVYKNGNLIIPSELEKTMSWVKGYYYKIGLLFGYGAYDLRIQNKEQRPCEVAINSKTSMVINGGFVTDRRDNYVQEVVPGPHQGVGLNPKVGIDSYFAFEVTDALRRPGRAVSVATYLIRGYEQEKKVIDRFNCAAFSYAGPFHCDDTAGSAYHLKVKGYDSKGNDWERVYEFYCEVATSPSPSTTWVPPEICLNGVMVNPGTSLAECYCGPYYEGKQCETKRCFNNGKLGFMSNCVCQVGYTGTYCLDVLCYQPSVIAPLNARAIVFVIRTGSSMADHMYQIATAVKGLAAMFETIDSTYIQQWILITVSQGIVGMNAYDSSVDFEKAIKQVPIVEDTVCNDRLYEGISAYLSSSYAEIYKRSSIYVFSDGLPDDSEEIRFGLYHQLSFFRGQIFFMLADSTTGRCNIDTSSESYRGLRYIAQFTHGHVIYSNVKNLTQTIYSLGATMYKPVQIMTNDFLDSCKKAPQYQSFFVDESIRRLFISATGNDLNPTVYYPDRTQVELTSYYHSDDFYIWIIEDAPIGGYLLTLNSGIAAPCDIRVYGTADTPLWVGISSELNEDAESTLPTTTEGAHIVAYINGVGIPEDRQIHAEATLWSNEGVTDKRVVMYASNGIYRDNCAYNLYFGAYSCVRPYEFFYVNIYMTSASGSVVQRSSTAYCSTSRPTISPSEDCLNGGVMGGPNNTCICPAHYSGDKCETIHCLNSGTATAGICYCIKGFSGTFCEIKSCTIRNRYADFSPNQKSLGFIIQDSISTRTTINGIVEQLPSLYQDLTHQQRDWITNYQIWRFNDSTFTQIVTTTDITEFLNGMIELKRRNQAHSDPSCRNLDVLPGILGALLHSGVTYDGHLYLFINGYMNVNETLTNTITAIYEMLERTRVKLNVVLMSATPCGQDLSENATKVLMNLAAFSGGEFMMVMPSKAKNVVRSIPTVYRASYIYENYAENCTDMQTFYFPVDSQMQSFTAYVLGEYDEKPVYFRPDGSRKYPYNLWTDIGMGSVMDQIIKECDDGWSLFDNRCWLIGANVVNWTEARDECHRNNANLMSIFNKAEQEFCDSKANGVDYWLGLNDQMHLGEYEWDTVDGTRLLLKNTGFVNWGPDEPKTDPNKRCVYDSTSTRWTVTNCGENRPFICVKHAYDADFEPDFSNVGEHLSRGIWKMNVKTLEGPCYVQIYGQSGIEMYTLFNTDVHADDGEEQPATNADNNRFLAHITNQVSTSTGNAGVLKYAHLYEYNMNIVQAQTFEKRKEGSCSYEYLSSSFECPADQFLSLATGIDRFGYLYQRIQPVACFKGVQPGECDNGVYHNGFCICDVYYEGDLCEIPMCQYGSLTANKERCKCYTGYTGPLCNDPYCNRGVKPSKEPSPGNRTFENLLTQIILITRANKDWFTHYTGAIFRDSKVADSISEVIEEDDGTAFVEKIMAEYNKPYTPTSEDRSIMAAVNKVLQSDLVQYRSYVWIITTGVPEDADSITIALDAAAKRHAYVNFLIAGDTGAPGGVPYNDKRLMACFDLVAETGGQFYQTDTTLDGFFNMWRVALITLYNVYYITVRQLQDCSKGITEYIQLGFNSAELAFDIAGTRNVSLSDPNDNPIEAKSMSASQTNIILSFANIGGNPGLWKVQLPPSEGFCSLSIRGEATLDVYIGFSQDLSTDGGIHSNEVKAYPVAHEQPNAVVAYANFGTLNFAQIYTNDERTLLWSSPLIRRQYCVYQYISSNTFICLQHSLAVVIDGEDDKGYPFRRLVHVHCIGSIDIPTFPTPNFTEPTLPSTTPYPTLPTPQCNNGGKADIMLMLDGSAGITSQDFMILVAMVHEMFDTYTIDGSHTRVFVGSYSDMASSVTTNFDQINSNEDLLNYLSKEQVLGHSGVLGNNVTSIFELANRLSWRDTALKVLIFVSTIGWDKSNSGIPFPDPTNAAEQFKNRGGKIIPIGLGANANSEQLTSIGGNCVKLANDVTYFDRVILSWLAGAACK